MDPTDEPIGPDNALPAESSALEKLLLMLAVVLAALVFLPLTVDGAEHGFLAVLRKFGFWSCLACMAASWLLETSEAA